LDERLVLLRNHLKNCLNNLTEEEIKVIVQKTDGFSGSDIIISIRDACFESNRKLEKANYFQEITIENKLKYKVVDDNLSQASGVKKMKFIDIDPNEILVPEITIVKKTNFL